MKCIIINKEGVGYEKCSERIAKDSRFGVAIQPRIDARGRHNVLHLDEGLTTAAYLIITNKKKCEVYYLNVGPILLEWKDVEGIQKIRNIYMLSLRFLAGQTQ